MRQKKSLIFGDRYSASLGNSVLKGFHFRPYGACKRWLPTAPSSLLGIAGRRQSGRGMLGKQLAKQWRDAWWACDWRVSDAAVARVAGAGRRR